jgi:hypothetical protein
MIKSQSFYFLFCCISSFIVAPHHARQGLYSPFLPSATKKPKKNEKQKNKSSLPSSFLSSFSLAFSKCEGGPRFIAQACLEFMGCCTGVKRILYLQSG